MPPYAPCHHCEHLLTGSQLALFWTTMWMPYHTAPLPCLRATACRGRWWCWQWWKPGWQTMPMPTPMPANTNTSKHQHQHQWAPTPIPVNATSKRQPNTREHQCQWTPIPIPMNIRTTNSAQDKQMAGTITQGWQRTVGTLILLQTWDDRPILFFVFLISFYFSSISKLSPLWAPAHRVFSFI